MPKPRKSKRQLIRDERRKKRRDRDLTREAENRAAKRQRRETEEATGDEVLDQESFENDGERPPKRGPGPEREFFGMLADEEQEYFRRADELLELNDFPSAEDRLVFIENVFKEARGKELKLASSQSCSRLMERLIMLSNTEQKKHLFEAFKGHFVTLVTHRFASHCCEQLFIQSAPVVSEELSTNFADIFHEKGHDEAPELSMEQLFLLALDEFEDHLTYLISERFASHTLRVILVILSGRPLDQLSLKSLLQSKKKEYITVPGGVVAGNDRSSEVRSVPDSFALAIQKIISDSTSNMDETSLRVLATHPTGNPVLQLLLELDISLNTKSKADTANPSQQSTLLDRLLPGAPQSLNETDSAASSFFTSMLYDPIGSRLLETLVTHCPGKIFKALQHNFFGPRIHSYLRNDIACYPAIRALNRLSKDDLVAAVAKILPTVPALVEKGRFSTLKTLFERCDVRGAKQEIELLLDALVEACGGDKENLVPKLCFPPVETKKEKGDFNPTDTPKNAAALVTHGSHLVTALLSIQGAPSAAVQASLLALPADKLVQLATTSPATSAILLTALRTPAARSVPVFHKSLVAALVPHAPALSASVPGHHVLNAVAAARSSRSSGSSVSNGNGASGGGGAVAVPFHLKEAVVTTLAAHEAELREAWTGRAVWRAWKGELWRRRRAEWVRWAKAVADGEGAWDVLPAAQRPMAAPAEKGLGNRNGNGVGGGVGGGVGEGMRRGSQRGLQAQEES